VAENLSRTFEEDIPNSGIHVRRYPSIITSSSEAHDIAAANHAAVIVWGNYTPSLIELEVQVGTLEGFPHIPFERGMVEQTANVRVYLTDERRQSAAIQVLDLLNILGVADGSEYDLILTLMYASTVNTPGGIVKDNSVAAHLHRALMNYRTNTEKAIQELTDALALDGSNPLVYSYRSLANLRAGADESAIADLETARRLGPANWTLPLYMLAESVGADQTDVQLAVIQNYGQIIDLRPDDWFAYFMRGIVYYYGTDDFASAQADLQHAIDLGANANLPYIPLLMIALREGRMADAQALMRTMLTEYPDPELTNRAMQALYGSRADQDFTGTFFSAATNLVLGQYDSVVQDIQVVEDFLTAHPDQIDLSRGARDLGDLFMLQGVAYCDLQNYTAARHAFDNAITTSADFELLYLLRGQMRQASDDNSGAQDDFARARVNVLGPEFSRWVETAISGEWSCQNMLEYQMPE
jgi:tetratricopeptide (TPR) repeat protein